MIPSALGAARRIRPAFTLPMAAALLLVAAPPAWADLLSPESGASPNANLIDRLYWIVFGMGVVIFFLVEGLLIYSLVKYRFKRDAPEPAQIRGNTRLEIGWTGAAIVLVVIISVITFIELPGIRTPATSGPAFGPQAEAGRTNNGVLLAATDQPPAPDRKAITIDVTGLQYLWRYDYPERGVYSYYEMVVPVNTTVILRITSQDVVHSWWIPELGGKFDAVPGHVNDTWFKALSVGEYDGQCAELCGENHAQMYARVRAVTPTEYRAYIGRQQAAIRSAQEQLARGRQQEESVRQKEESERRQAEGEAQQEEGEPEGGDTAVDG